jgi:hypothetical protein
MARLLQRSPRPGRSLPSSDSGFAAQAKAFAPSRLKQKSLPQSGHARRSCRPHLSENSCAKARAGKQWSRQGAPAFGGMDVTHKELMGLDQIGIALCGVIAVWLTQDQRESRRRWACIFGMLGQPFWFYATWKAEQWGILALCTLYTYAWARGVWTYWLSPLLKTKWRPGRAQGLG